MWLGEHVIGFVQVCDAITCRVWMAKALKVHSLEGCVIEGSPRSAMSAILVKSRENKFSGLRKSWGVSTIILIKHLLVVALDAWMSLCESLNTVRVKTLSMF